MGGYKSGTLHWIILWGAMTIMWAWLSHRTQATWIFYIVIASFVILVGGLVYNCVKVLHKKKALRDIDVAFYQKGNRTCSNNYTVGIGTSRIYLMITTRTTAMSLNSPDLIFEGDELNKPINEGRDYGDMFTRTQTGQIRDWLGNVTDPSSTYPKPLSVGQKWPHGIRVITTGPWCGKLHVQIPVVGGPIIQRYLDFTVVSDKKELIGTLQNPVFSPMEPASTTQV